MSIPENRKNSSKSKLESITNGWMSEKNLDWPTARLNLNKTHPNKNEHFLFSTYNLLGYDNNCENAMNRVYLKSI